MTIWEAYIEAIFAKDKIRSLKVDNWKKGEESILLTSKDFQ